MDKLEQMQLFARVVETGSFSRAAKAEQVSQSSASKQIAALEQALGAQLLRRTPRGLSVTDQGRSYYNLVVDTLERLEAGESKIHATAEGAKARLRISITPIFARDLLVPQLPELFQRFPGLSLELDVSERYVNLIEEGFDLAVRVGKLHDTTLVAKKIGCLRPLLVAAPDYLTRHKTPLTPADLKTHTCLPFMFEGKAKPWQFMVEKRLTSFSPEGRFKTNDGDSIHAAVLRGLGISQGPSWMYGANVRSGSLRALLTNYAPPLVPIHAVSVPGHRQRNGVLRGFVSFLAEIISGESELRMR